MVIKQQNDAVTQDLHRNITRIKTTGSWIAKTHRCHRWVALLSTDWLRLITTCWQSVCVFKSAVFCSNSPIWECCTWSESDSHQETWQPWWLWQSHCDPRWLPRGWVSASRQLVGQCNYLQLVSGLKKSLCNHQKTNISIQFSFIFIASCGFIL